MESKEYKNEIDLRRFRRELHRRKWLYISVGVLIFGAAIAYVARKEPEHTAHSALLIEDNSNESQGRGGSLMQMMRVFSMGGFNSASVDNEMLLVNTYDVAMRTARTLDLNITCVQNNGITKRTMFEDSPVALTMPEGTADTLAEGYRVDVTLNGDKADIRAYKGRFFTSTLAEKKGVTLPCTVTTPLGSFTVGLTGLPAGNHRSYTFGVTGYAAAADVLMEKVRIDVTDKLADGISFEYTDRNRRKAAKVLDTMMAEYNAKRLDRKRETALTELNFITDRINRLYTDIVDTERKVEQFKSENNFVDIEAEAPILLETTLDAHEQLLKASAQMIYYEQVLDILRSSRDTMLPAVATPGSENNSQDGSMIKEYNEQMGLLLELRRSAKPGNNALAAAETRVAQMRASIISSISQLLDASKKVIASRGSMVGSMDTHLRKLPKYEREYINLSRDQLLKNELYAFLVEKRENALLKLNSEDTLGFVIDPAYLDLKPSKTKMLIILGAGLILAICVPCLIAVIMMRRKDTVDNPFDLRFAQLEERCFETFGKEERLSAVRNRILEMMAHGTIYVADTTSGSLMAAADLADSFTRAGYPVREIMAEGEFNDEFLSSAFASRINEGKEGFNYVILPEPREIKDIAPAINAAGSVAVVFIESGTFGRKEFAGMISGIDTSHLIVIIVAR